MFVSPVNNHFIEMLKLEENNPPIKDFISRILFSVSSDCLDTKTQKALPCFKSITPRPNADVIAFLTKATAG